MYKKRFLSPRYGVFCILALVGLESAQADAIHINNANFDVANNQLVVIGKLGSRSSDQVIVLKDFTTRKVLDTQVTSKKNFQFHFQPLQSTGIPCAVSVTWGEQTDMADVKHAPTNCSPTPATLTGRIVDDPLPFATVTVTVGGQSFTTIANENGEYSIDIVSSLLDDLLLIEASAENPNDPGTTVNFVSLAGSFSKVLAEETVDVTNVTTANYALLLEANGGTAPATVEELITAEKSVDATALLQLAAVIKLIVDDPTFSIPEDEFGEPLFDNLIDFVTSAAAVNTFIEEVTAADPDNNPLTDMMLVIINDTDLIPGFDEAEIPARYYAIQAAVPGFLARGGETLEFAPDSTGSLLGVNYSTGEALDQSFVWNVTDGRLNLLFDLPVTTAGLAPSILDTTATPEQIALYFDCVLGFSQIPLIATEVSRTYTLLNNGELVDQAQGDYNSLFDYDLIPYDCGDGNAGNIDLADKLFVFSSRSGLRDSSKIVTIPFTPEMLNNEWATYYLFDNEDTIFGVTPRGIYYDILSFDPGGTSTGLFSAENASWVIDDGDLLITYFDGATQRLRILDQLDKEYGVFHEVTVGDTRSSVYDLALKVNPATNFDGTELVNGANQFWGGMINSWLVGGASRLADGSLNPAAWFGWRLQEEPVADSVGSFLGDGDGDGEYDDLFWQERDIPWTLLPDGRVQLQRFVDRQRWWIPLEIDVASTGERRMYVIEWSDQTGEGRYINPRINIEQEFEIPAYDYLIED